MLDILAFFILIALLFGINAARGLFGAIVSIIVFVIVGALILCVLIHLAKSEAVRGLVKDILWRVGITALVIGGALLIIPLIQSWEDKVFYNYAYIYDYGYGDIHGKTHDGKWSSIEGCKNSFNNDSLAHLSGQRIYSAVCGKKCEYREESNTITCEDEYTEFISNEVEE